MSPEEYRFFHHSLDLLLAEYIKAHPEVRVMDLTVVQLGQWAFEQSKVAPDDA